MDNLNKSEEGIKLNVRDIMFYITTSRYIIVAIVALCTLAMFAYTKLTYVAKYTSCAKIYVVDSDAASINSSEIAVSTYLARDYLELIIDRTVLNAVNNELNLGMSYGSLKNCVSVKAPENTRIIEVYVTTTNPQKSMKIANKICEVAQEKITALTAVDRVNIFSEAYLPTSPIASNMNKNLLLGFSGGVAVSAVYVFIVYSLNDKINNADDIERHLGIAVLGSIPYHKSKVGKKSYGRRTAEGKKYGK